MLKYSQKNKILFLAENAMLAALAVVFMLVVRFPLIPSAAFLEFDMGDMPVIIATLLFGPGPGIAILFFVSLIQALTVSAASSWVGFVMHFLASGAYILTVSLFYKRKPSAKRLIAGVTAGSLAMTLLMIPLNLVLTSYFLGTGTQAVLQMMLPAIIPFNLLKGLINSAAAVFVFLPLKKILEKSHLLPVKELSNKK